MYSWACEYKIRVCRKFKWICRGNHRAGNRQQKEKKTGTDTGAKRQTHGKDFERRHRRRGSDSTNQHRIWQAATRARVTWWTAGIDGTAKCLSAGNQGVHPKRRLWYHAVWWQIGKRSDRGHLIKLSDKLYIRVKGGYETEVTLLEE